MTVRAIIFDAYGSMNEPARAGGERSHGRHIFIGVMRGSA
jgi:hypothetical protein